MLTAALDGLARQAAGGSAATCQPRTRCGSRSRCGSTRNWLRRPATGSTTNSARFELKETDELERAGRALVEGLEKNPALLYTLRGGKFALDLARHRQCAVSHLAARLVAAPDSDWRLGDASVDGTGASAAWSKTPVRRVRRQREDLVSTTLTTRWPAGWREWPATGGSSIEKLQQVLQPRPGHDPPAGRTRSWQRPRSGRLEPCNPITSACCHDRRPLPVPADRRRHDRSGAHHGADGHVPPRRRGGNRFCARWRRSCAELGAAVRAVARFAPEVPAHDAPARRTRRAGRRPARQGEALDVDRPLLVIMLMGGTGVGKSTLLNALAGGPIAQASFTRPDHARPGRLLPPLRSPRSPRPGIAALPPCPARPRRAGAEDHRRYAGPRLQRPCQPREAQGAPPGRGHRAVRRLAGEVSRPARLGSVQGAAAAAGVRVRPEQVGPLRHRRERSAARRGPAEGPEGRGVPKPAPVPHDRAAVARCRDRIRNIAAAETSRPPRG